MFCFTIPYGLVLVGGGLFGYIQKGSIPSLAGGAGFGFLLIIAGYAGPPAAYGNQATMSYGNQPGMQQGYQNPQMRQSSGVRPHPGVGAPYMGH
ncbi:TMEM14 family [Sesbania bispinosa]|nr:TMEM14 family [Sesbania bispinosa]